MNESESSCSLKRHESSKNTISNISNSSASGPSLSSIAPKSPTGFLNHIKSLQGVSETKVVQYKTLLEQVNTAYIEYKMSEFLVGCARESQKEMKPQVRARVQTIMANSAAQDHVKLKSANGASFNILGISDEDVTRMKEAVLSPLEKTEFNKHMNETVKRKVEELKKQEQVLLGKCRSLSTFYDIFAGLTSSSLNFNISYMLPY